MTVIEMKNEELKIKSSDPKISKTYNLVPNAFAIRIFRHRRIRPGRNREAEEFSPESFRG